MVVIVSTERVIQFATEVYHCARGMRSDLTKNLTKHPGPISSDP